jgi:hypothetical protein
MKSLLKLEELAKLIAACVLSIYLGYEWWMYLLLFFLPDLSMVGYLWGTKPGAVLYNLFHHYATGIVIALTGFMLQVNGMVFCGLILIGHTAFDRVLGYGLKHFAGFRFTHLGMINKKNHD